MYPSLENSTNGIAITCSHIDKSVRIRRMKLIRRGIRQRTVSLSMSIVIVIAVEGNQYVAGDGRTVVPNVKNPPKIRLKIS